MADTFTSKGLIIQDPALNYDIAKHNTNYQKINDIIGTVICTSTTRPSTDLFDGMTLWETDTRRFVVRVSGAWVVVPGVIIVADAAARNAITTKYDGQMVYRQDTDWTEVYDGAAWRVQGLVTTSALANITNPFTGQLAILSSDLMIYRWTGSAWLGEQHTAVDGGFARYRRTTNQASGWVNGTWTRQAYNVSMNTSADVTPNGSFDQFTLNRTGVWDIRASSRTGLNSVDLVRYQLGIFPGATPGTGPHDEISFIEHFAISNSVNLKVDTLRRYNAGDIICIASLKGGGSASSSLGNEEHCRISLRWVGP